MYIPERKDRVRFVHHTKRGDETIVAVVHFIELRGDYFYFGYTPDDPRFGAWGYARLYVEPRPYGVISMEKIGEARQAPDGRWYPSPGNTGYDLMC